MSTTTRPRAHSTSGHACLACGSYSVRIVRRVVRCRDCEIAYYLPSHGASHD